MFFKRFFNPLTPFRGFNFCLLLSALFLFSLKNILDHPPLPSHENSIVIYSNQLHATLAKPVFSAVQEAKKNILLSTFGLVDENLLSLLIEKDLEGVSIEVHYDQKTFSQFPTIPGNIHQVGHIGKGLMHQKIITIDDETVYLGSTNLSSNSFKIHDNLLIGIRSVDFTKKVIEQLKNPEYLTVIYESLDDANLFFWSLPGQKRAAMQTFVSEINRAKTKIDCQIFTLTHPKIVDALCSAAKRGVIVELTIDKKSLKGASKDAVEVLRSEGVKIFTNNHSGLMHHKMMFIDEEKLFFGSANWTRSAFEKNRDYLVLLEDLSDKLRGDLIDLFQATRGYKKPYRTN